ncbi:MAG TPA: flagellar hook-associated protein FlgK [Thiobacillaceae bacterium]|nr:flagellar hook-associated protein FlgK [Thiobacillaceae bacterium]HNU62980.1 flagellar hook-associated protein FlgK [Thiobacillaceae bacterium]
MASGILGIALTGLNAAQAGLRTTQHNIANVNTAGYRRQETILATARPQSTLAGSFGNGADVDTVRSLYSRFLDNQLLQGQSQLAHHTFYSAAAGQIDQLLGDADSGLATALDRYFNAIHELADDPGSGAARQLVLSAGNSLAGRINILDAQLRSAIATGNGELDQMVGQANLRAGQIARLNAEIARVEAAQAGQPANDLRDLRQKLIGELNEVVNVSLVQQGDGPASVFIGNGQPLVLGDRAYSLGTAVDPGNSMLRVPTIDLGGTPMRLQAAQITGGRMGGLLAYREDVLLPAFDDLNDIAAAIASEVNGVHGGGLDYNLNPGTDFFTDPASVPAGDYARSMRMLLSSADRVAAAGAGATGPGDNANALALAALRFKPVLASGTASFGEAYGQTIARTASHAAQADVNLSAFTSLVRSAEADSRAVSGVNLDEEAVNLIRFQQAYQASAKAMQIAAGLFDEVLAVVR